MKCIEARTVQWPEV